MARQEQGGKSRQRVRPAGRTATKANRLLAGNIATRPPATGRSRAGGVTAGARETPPPVDIRNLPACIQDIVLAAQDVDPGPPEPLDFHQLRGRLEAARVALPPLYRESFLVPFVRVLDQLGPQGYAEVLMKDPQREREAGLLLDVAQTILQNGEDYQLIATDAFEEVVSDLYDGFLSAEDRRGVEPPDLGVIPPLVKWGNPTFGPYTWPVDVTSQVFDMGAGVVNLPPTHARTGLLAWAALGHEVGGHDILHADVGLADELSEAVTNRLASEGLATLGTYWGERIDETASDVLGILNMGPAAGIGLIGYFRGLDLAFGGQGKLRNRGPSSDPHPADILRGYLAGYVVARLRFDRAADWSQVILAETEKDLVPAELVLAGKTVTPANARKSAELVADTLVAYKAAALENHSLGSIQNWRNRDEEKVEVMRRLLISGIGSLPERVVEGVYAAHLVAAGVTAALAAESDVRRIFDRMLRLLKQMHDQNPSWGPLFIRHPGDVKPHYFYPYPSRMV
ncbi:hypothetical protein [Pyxidicoccus parkwayensis]|uniref:hypothetical protein n=1 Tax=Pyxidicoccus parkwayensis TaxID=2813578 RepID=UPI001F51193E|nr:hypothetical protein [Pyxidicoccus parkwaysis]